METRTCQNCKNDFVIESDDFSFYEKIQVPPPTFCPECRFVRRLSFRNERSLYHRTCDSCKQKKIFMYPESTPFPVFCKECWWQDVWDPFSYGMQYDFNQPFFPQFYELMKLVPRPGTIQQGNNIQSDYSNRVTDMRNCYLVFGTIASEYSMYSNIINGSKECMDDFYAVGSEQCYECIDVSKCYRCYFCCESQECAESYFLYNCRNCTNCFGCVNVRNKSNCIFNQQYSPEDYKKFIEEFKKGGREAIAEAQAKIEELKKDAIHPWMVCRSVSNSSGNWIEHSENAVHVFSSNDCEDVKYGYSLSKAKDSMDYSFWGSGSELVYDTINTGIQCSNIKWNHESWTGDSDLTYCTNCHSSKNLFGCIGLKNAEYCVFNVQYSKEDYEALVTKIISQMKELPYIDAHARAYSYGEFYPYEFSPFAYNETVAQEFFPLSKEEAQSRGYLWVDEVEKKYQATVDANNLPNTIEEVDEAICKEVISCLNNGKTSTKCTSAFKIIPDELAFYKRFSLPLPQYCSNCRHFNRLSKRNPLKLWPRSCICDNQSHGHSGMCPNEFETSYSPDRPEKVYCEQCYQREVI